MTALSGEIGTRAREVRLPGLSTYTAGRVTPAVSKAFSSHATKRFSKARAAGSTKAFSVGKMRGALSRLRAYHFWLSPSRIALPKLVEFETIPQLFNRLAIRYSDSGRAALGYKDKKAKRWLDVTWDELAEHVHSFAGYLHRQGIRKGDHVAILCENRPEWAITDLATQLLGAVNVPLYTTLPVLQAGTTSKGILVILAMLLFHLILNYMRLTILYL